MLLRWRLGHAAGILPECRECAAAQDAAAFESVVVLTQGQLDAAYLGTNLEGGGERPDSGAADARAALEAAHAAFPAWRATSA